MRDAKAQIAKLLHEDFGHQEFRPGQEEIIRALLSGRDVLAVMPTGAGKSLVYQLASQLLPGPTIVVSPLLSLMHDQVEALRANGLGASMINSAMSDDQAGEQLNQLTGGQAKLLYVTPERFENAEFMAAVRRIQIALFVVDEAHCVTEWGHSFRPAYLRLASAIARLGRPTVLALTATAPPWVKHEITERLGLREPLEVVRGLDRPNLFFEVRRVETEEADRRTLQQLLSANCGEYPAELAHELGQAMQGNGIIYTATTAAARQTATWLRKWGIAADYYHGQRNKADRARVQQAFMSGDLRVIAATNAFGLGVDKPDVRFVIHRDIPASIEAYYQEAGRAGRDGALARCVLIYRPGDLGRTAFLAAGGRLTAEELERAWNGLLRNPQATVGELQAATGLGKADLLRAIELLKHERAISERRGRLHLRVPDFDLTRISLEDEQRRVAYEHSRVEMMRGYAEANTCRRRYFLSYFGDTEEVTCQMCDVDVPRTTDERIAIGPDTPAAPEKLAPFGIGKRVEHSVWGAGTVQSASAGQLTVLFDTVGYKTLATASVQERGLLSACLEQGA